jgi:serine/threonine protein kinase
MEYSGKRNLHRVIHRSGGFLSVKQSQNISAQVADAVAHCHTQGVAHCDVKPENIVLADSGISVQLVDFGTAVLTNESCIGCQGTVCFMGPEILSGHAYEPAATDVWATGVVIMEMLCGSCKMNRVMGWNMDGLRPSPRLHAELVSFFERPEALRECLEDDHVVPTPDLLDLLQGALNIAPACRSTAAQLVSSQWLSKKVSAEGL